MRRALWLTTGFGLVALGFIGIVVPLMPTVVFWILAAAAFSRSSPRLETWILDHPHFGHHVRDWRARGAIPVVGKMAAIGGMAGGYAVFFHVVSPGLLLALTVATLLLLTALWIITRPS